MHDIDGSIMICSIQIFPSRILNRPSQPVTSFDDTLKKIVKDMIETMHAAPGVGLAAPQINVPKQIAIIEYQPKSEEEADRAKIPLTIIINPKIIHFSKDKDRLREGCLSIPGVELLVTRSKKIKLNAQSIDGQPFKIHASGFFARVIQHEIDHLNGILIIDEVKKR